MARLSAKQLRSYDAAGLLTPARTDADTGYRYYHPGQLRTALTISMLRSLDIPLERIGELLVAGDDEAQALPQDRAERCTDEIAARQRAARSLARLSSDRELMPHVVTTGSDPEVHLIARTATTTSEALYRDSTQLIDALIEELRRRPTSRLSASTPSTSTPSSRSPSASRPATPPRRHHPPRRPRRAGAPHRPVRRTRHSPTTRSSHGLRSAATSCVARSASATSTTPHTSPQTGSYEVSISITTPGGP